MSTMASNPVINDYSKIAKLLQRRDIFDYRKAALRVVLLEKEQFSLPRLTAWNVKILSGTAWVVISGEDYYLSVGENVMISKMKYAVIISSLEKSPLLVEISVMNDI